MASVKLAENIHWVGAVDWDIRDFHGYETRRGTTYNAYLIKDEKTALVDTVKYQFQDKLTRNIRELTSLEKLDYVIVNHVEKDHSSSLPHIVQYARDATIIATRIGKDGLMKYYGGEDWSFQVVKTGDEVNLGRRTLRFVEAPMLHWPDSMFTFVKEEEILMPNDAFGQHLASSQRFDGEIEESILMDEAAKYYANILMPFAPQIIRKIEELSGLGIKPRMIAPSHGVIWRSDPGKIVNAYLEWSKGLAKRKAVIVYDTMWGSTQEMAHAISDAIAKQGLEVQVFHIRNSDLAEIMKHILDAKVVLIGAPTINNNMFPTVSLFLNHAIGLRPKGKLWSSFGSYGWGGGALKGINQQLREAGFEVIEPSLSIRYAPNQEELQKCKEFGEKIVAVIK